MKSVLVHGCYDLKTLKTLETFGVSFVFDLRARSSNLVPFHHLKTLLPHIHSSEVFLSFEDDRPETIESSLSLLKDFPQKLTLIFRDHRPASFYHNLDHSFFWMFHPEGDWRTILTLPGLRGVLLPIKWQSFYQSQNEMWSMIEARNLDVYIHADSFEETLSLESTAGLKLSIDLTSEVEVGFRTVDQEKLKRMKIWRSNNESPLS